MLNNGWREARRNAPCPICGKPQWCIVAPDGFGVICHRVPSDRPQRGGGWFHRIGESKTAAPQFIPAPAPIAARDFNLLAQSFSSAVNPERLQRFARDLGLSAESLERLNIGWAGMQYCPECERRKNAWGFPMLDPNGSSRGIRLRFPDCRHKSSIRGGKQGLFIPRNLCGDRLFICEGPTDTAAVLDLGLAAIGRPSCTGGESLVVQFVQAKQSIRELVILADNDVPGRNGAEAFAGVLRTIHREVKIITPPAGIKDARAWKLAGATAEAISGAARTARRVALQITLVPLRRKRKNVRN